MRRGRRLAAGLLVLALAAGGVEVGRRTKSEAHRLITNPIGTRTLPGRRPIDYGMAYDDVAVTTQDGLRLVGGTSLRGTARSSCCSTATSRTGARC